MPKPDFADARAKLDRARKHIADLDALIASFLSTDFYKLTTDLNEGEGRIKYGFDSLHQPDKQLNVILGDAISNLRSTLDYLTIAIAKPITAETDKAYFPFADDANGFKGMCGGAALALDAELIAHFVENLQAYRGGKGEPLWAINKLRNIDKHRFLIATVELAALEMSFKDARGNVFERFVAQVPAGQHANVIDAPMNHVQFTKQPKPSFEVRFNEPDYVTGPVIPFLKKAADQIQTIFDGLDVVFASRP